ncbi:hypothetical protein [Nocardioides pakistanensis]
MFDLTCTSRLTDRSTVTVRGIHDRDQADRLAREYNRRAGSFLLRYSVVPGTTLAVA